MPIFEYKCNNCQEEFEILQLPGHDYEPRCKACGGADLKKLISVPFLPSSVGRPAHDEIKCAGCGPSKQECPAAGACTPNSCCANTD